MKLSSQKKSARKIYNYLISSNKRPGCLFQIDLRGGVGGGEGGGGGYQGGGGDLIPKLMEKAMIKRMAMLNDFTINPLMHMPQNGQNTLTILQHLYYGLKNIFSV